MRTEYMRDVGIAGRVMLAGAAMLLAGSVWAQSPNPTATSAPAYSQPINTPQEFVHLATKSAVLRVVPSVVDLGEWTRPKGAASQKLDGVMQVGSRRASVTTSNAALTDAQLQWQTSSRGGRIAALSFESPAAFGMRLGVLIDKLPGSALLRVYSQARPDDVFEIAGQRVLQTLDINRQAGDDTAAGRTWWTPAVDDDEVTLEIELPPGIATSSVQVSVPSVLHVYEDLTLPMSDGSDAAVQPKIGEALSCQQDATCYDQYDAQRNAVARMIFVEGDGAYLCTGTLVGDKAKSGTPYFLTANHCISDQTAASSLQTYWFYRSPSCNARTLSPASRTLKNGATLLYSSTAPDASLLRLNDTPPGGAVFAGWNAETQIRNSAVVGIHHPRGDLLKISRGLIDGGSDCTVNSSGGVNCVSPSATSMSGSYYRVKWSAGTTEGGSSGSGLFINGALTGVLSSGTGVCTVNKAYTFYSRLDSLYPALKKWLAAESAVTPGTGTSTGTGTGTGTDASTGARTAVYRFYNYKSGAHFYTVSADERDFVIRTYPEFQYENVAFYAYALPTAGKDAVYRFYNSQSGAHFYTISAEERDYVAKTYAAFRLEGPVWYGQKQEGDGASPIYRFYNSRTGAHFYTVSASERDFVISDYKDFQYEGPVYYVWTAP